MAKMTTPTNTLTSPVWLAEFLEPNRLLVPGGARLVSADFVSTTFTITAPAGASLGATSIVVTALPVALPSGTVLDWTGVGELSVLTADAALGATSLAVGALDAAIEASDTASYTTTGVTPVRVVSGTLIGRTRAERAANTGFGPWASGDEEVYLTPFDVLDVANNSDVEMLRNGAMVYENWLPGWSGLVSLAQAEIRARYQCIVGKEVS